jgi:Ca2+-binding EF-hand superfamily protein
MKAFIGKIRATKVQDIQEAVAHEVQQSELIDEIWTAYDKDNSGQLSVTEMRSFVVAYLTKLGEADRLPEKQFNALFNSIDINHDG